MNDNLNSSSPTSNLRFGNHLRALLASLKACEELSASSPQVIIVLLQLSVSGEIGAKELTTDTGLASSTVSRSLRVLSSWRDRDTKELHGYGMVDYIPDPYDRRMYTYKLNEKGKKVVAEMAAAMMEEL
jgi:DNA-binding MarR family transcriptional regulator